MSRWTAIVALALVMACSSGSGRRPPAADDHDGGSTLITRRLTLSEARAALWPKGGDPAYRLHAAEETRALGELIEMLWRGVEPPGPAALASAARRAGVVIELWEIDGAAIWVVRAPDEARRGTGVYLIRAGKPPEAPLVLVEAPHVYFDLGTGAIAAAAFLGEGVPPSVRGLFTNSVHRYQQLDGTRGKRPENPADPAHDTGHPFQAATAAVVAAGPVLLAQLHGFDDGDAEDGGSDDGAGTDAIVSAGDRAGSTPTSTAVADGLAAALGATVQRYPEDTRVLGGTTNAQRRLIEGHAGARFVHIEMPARLRDRLRGDARAAAAIGRVLAGAAEVR